MIRAHEVEAAAYAQSRFGWEEEQRRLESNLAEEGARRRDVEAKLQRSEQLHLETVERLTREPRAREESLSQTIEDLRHRIEEMEAAAKQGGAAWEATRRELESRLNDEEAQRCDVESALELAQQALQGESTRLQKTFQQRETVLTEERDRLLRTVEDLQRADTENRRKWEDERQCLESRLMDAGGRCRELETENRLVQQSIDEERRRAPQISRQHEPVLDDEIELQHALDEEEFAARPFREERDDERYGLEAGIAQSASQGGNAESLSAPFELVRTEGTPSAMDGVKKRLAAGDGPPSAEPALPTSRYDPDEMFLALRGGSDLHLSSSSVDVLDAADARADGNSLEGPPLRVALNDPAGLDRMVRLARRQRAGFLSRVQKAAIYTSLGGAILAVIAGALYLAAQWVQN